MILEVNLIQRQTCIFGYLHKDQDDIDKFVFKMARNIMK